MNAESILYMILVFTTILVPLIPAYIIYRFLPSKTIVSGPFQGLNVQLSGAFGGYFLLVLVMTGFIYSRPPQTTYEVWTIEGNIVLGKEGGTLKASDISVVPSLIEFPSDKRFRLDVPIKRGQADQLVFPSLRIQHDGYESVSLPIDDKTFTLGNKSFTMIRDEKNKVVRIDGDIELQKAEVPYQWDEKGKGSP